MSASPLHLIVLQPDLERLSAYAARHRVLPLSGGDLGYALHHGLTALFGQAAPKPFRLIDRRFGAQQLLAYSPHDESALRDYTDLQSTSALHYAEAAAALGLGGLVLKPMPARWTQGRRYRFEARLRPVVRTTRNDSRKTGGGREIDAFIAASIGHRDETLDRGAIYEGWIAAALLRSGGAILDPGALKLTTLKRTRLHTRARFEHLIEGPDIVAQGVLRVADSDGFAALLARGLGRHRSFGFGMLLLSPAG